MAVVIEGYTTGMDANDQEVWRVDNDYERLAQTFTVGTTGTNLTYNVSSINVYLEKNGTPTDTITFYIYPVLPDGSPDENQTALASGTLDSSTVSTTAEWVNVTMTSASSLQPSTQYALVMDGSAMTQSNTDNVTWWYDNSSPTYAGGSHWIYDGSPRAWRNDSGTEDNGFQILGGDYAGTLCSLGEAISKAGANASSSSTNEASK